MSFLTINGFPLSVAEGSWRKPRTQLAKRDRAFAGEAHKDAWPFKRGFSGKTAPLLPDDAKLVRCLLSGQFDTISFDGALNSGKGVIPSAGAGTYEPSIAADGTLSSYGPIARAYGQALWGTPAVTNILTENESYVKTDLTGFGVTFAGTTMTRSTERFWYGAASVKVVCGSSDGTYDGIYVSHAATGCTGSNQYFHAHLYATGSGSVSVYLQNTTRSRTSSVVTATLTPDRWTRFDVACTADAAGDNFNFVIYEATVNSGITFYIDGLSLAKSNAPVPWCIGGTNSTALTGLVHPSAQLVSDEFSILGQVLIPTDAAAVYPVASLAELNASATGTQVNQLILTKPVGALTLSLAQYARGAVTAVGTSAALTAAAWTPWAVTSSPTYTAMRDKLQLLVGTATGSNFAHSNPTVVLPASAFVSLFSAPANLMLDDLLLLRMAITQAQYLTLAAAWDSLLPAPHLRVKGDAVAAELAVPSSDAISLAMEGTVHGSSYVSGYVAGVLHNDLAVIDFELEEV